MPPLSHPIHPVSVKLPPRSATVAAETDVLVIGSGLSGLGAALGAAAAGARVILAERYGFLGGHATAGLVMPFASFYTEHPTREKCGATTLFPTDHGLGEPVIAGIFTTFIDRMVKAGGAVPPSPETGYTVPFDPEIFKLIAMDLLDEAGVHFLFHALASDVINNQEEKGVIFETKSGPLIITAQVIVDCTGDGDVATKAGARYEIGRSEDGLVQPMTLMFRIVGFEHETFMAYVREHPDQWYSVHGLWNLIQKAIDAGELELQREDILFFGTPHEHEICINSTRVTQVLGTDVWDMTYAEREGRRQMHQIAQFLHRYVPGFEKAYIVQSGVNISVRETRRILGDYQLTMDDVLQARTFDDVIARCAYPIDIHNPKGKGTEFRHVPAGKAYDIPLRCLLPQGIEGIMVAGRCISGTHEAHSSYRVMPAAMATGQAAGVCAALASRKRITPKIVPVSDVQKELLRQGANLGNV